jgi:hypothetical protein
MAKSPRPTPDVRTRNSLKWVIKALEALRDSVCPQGPWRLQMSRSVMPPYDAECPPPPPGVAEGDLCAILDAVIKALKAIQRQLAVTSPVLPKPKAAR